MTDLMEAPLITDYDQDIVFLVKRVMFPLIEADRISEYEGQLLTDNYSIESVRICRVVVLSPEDWDHFTSHIRDFHDFLCDVPEKYKGFRQVTFVSNSETNEGVYVDRKSLGFKNMEL